MIDLIRDIFFIGGFLLLGYGLHLYHPPLAFLVCGVVMMLVALLIHAPQNDQGEQEADQVVSQYPHAGSQAVGRGQVEGETGLQRLRSWMRGSSDKNA